MNERSRATAVFLGWRRLAVPLLLPGEHPPLQNLFVDSSHVGLICLADLHLICSSEAHVFCHVGERVREAGHLAIYRLRPPVLPICARVLVIIARAKLES